MIKVWKCDFCGHTDISHVIMSHHENNCYCNPKLKNCYSCKNYDTFDYTNCSKNLDHWSYDDDGDCPEWETDNEKLLRKIKLKQLNTIKTK